MQKKLIYIDSGAQLTSSKNTWNVSIDINLEGDYNRITVIQSQIPVSYYVIGSGANTFTLTEGNSSVVITIPPANYNVFSFSTTVGALLTSASPNGYTYTISYPNSYTSADTGLFTYTVNSIAKTVSFTFPTRSPLPEQFGFVTGTTNFFSVSGLVQTLLSTNVVNFTPENSLYIRCSFCDGESTSEQSDVLLAVYGSNVQPYSTITFTNPCPLETSKRLSSKDRNLSFSICDENGQPIYMNGGNIQMTLMFYKDITVNTSIEEYIAMKTRLLELDVDENMQKEQDALKREEESRRQSDSANGVVSQEESARQREAQLKAREDVLKQREDDLAMRQEQLSLQQNNNVASNINEEEVTQTDSNIENRPEDQTEVYNDRPAEVLDQE
jgi:hypothetical protein